MKYISLDLEVSGKQNKNPNKILMVSMVLEDTLNPLPLEQLPHFTCFVQNYNIEGDLYALSMNSWIIDILSGRQKNTTNFPVMPGDTWVSSAHRFLNEHKLYDTVTVAGKNLANFDFHYLPESIKGKFCHRVLDPASLYVDFLKDEKLPNLSTCKERAGLENIVSHNAYEDALDTIRVLRKFYVKC